MEAIRELALTLFGSGDQGLEIGQMALRALVVYVLALALVRLGDKRFIGENSAFDFMMAIILGSIVSRAITGNAPFWPTMAASVVLVAVHWALAWVGFRSDRVGTLVKGRPRMLIEDGEIDWDQMRKASIGEEDLLSALRRNGGVEDPGDVTRACLERNGSISVIPRE
jgi:uncharacterized membrane protein YcaP (DUF421 family)